MCLLAVIGKVSTEIPREFELSKDIYVTDCKQPLVEKRNEMFTKIKLVLLYFLALRTHKE